MKKEMALLSCVVLFAGSFGAQSVDISGTVTNATGGAALANVNVTLKGLTGVVATTGADGKYHLTGSSAVRFEPAGQIASSYGLHGMFFTFSATVTTPVSIELFTAEGAKAATLVNNRPLAGGSYTLDLSNQNLPSSMYFIRYRQGTESKVFRFIPMSKTIGPSGTATATNAVGLAKSAAGAVDTLVFALSGFYPAKAPITAYTGTYDAVLQPLPVGTAPAGMRLIAAGTFTMGTTDQNQYYATPPHQVTITQSFYMDTTEVTQKIYKLLMNGQNPAPVSQQGDQNPAIGVNWFDAVLFCNARSKRDNKDTVYSYTSASGEAGKNTSALAGLKSDLTKNGYRLATEAEWEYAARAGTTTKYSWGTTLDGSYCWYYMNCSGPQPVATKKPNAWGLYDMYGNAWEWCNDWWNYYTADAQTDPTGPAVPALFTDLGKTDFKVSRGGAYGPNDDNIDFMPAAHRSFQGPSYNFQNNGIRCVCR